MNNRKKLGIAYIIGSFIFIGLIIYGLIFNKEFAEKYNFKLLLLAITYFVAFYRMFYKKAEPSSSLNFYKKFYADIIKDSFEDDKKNQKCFLKAIYYYNVNKYEKALKKLLFLLDACSTRNEKYAVNVFLALTYTDDGQQKKAVGIYESMVNAGLADSLVFSNLIDCYRCIGQYEQAYKTGELALHTDPKNHDAYCNLAYVFFEDGNYDKAKEYAEKSLNLKGNFISPIHLLYVISNLENNNEQILLYERKALANGDSKEDLRNILDYYCH